jgi:NtrC-family two-component system sensor histidine kinase KinB
MTSLNRRESHGTTMGRRESPPSLDPLVQRTLENFYSGTHSAPSPGIVDKASILKMPIERYSRVLGMITLESSKRDHFGPSEESLVRQLANQAAIALQNANLFADVSDGRDRLSAIINSVKEGIILVDTDGEILFVNEPIQNFTEAAYTEFTHKNLSDLPDRVLEVLNYTREQALDLQNALQKGQNPAIQKTEHQVERASAHPLVLERETSPVYGGEGHVIGWMIVLRDKTEEYEVAQARDVITQTLVHDLRSPMSAVVGAIDLVETALADGDHDDIIRQAMRVAHSGADRVISMVDTLLEISRLESNQIQLVFTPVKIPHLVWEILSDFVLLANESGLFLQNKVPETLPTIMADGEKIKRVITNLLDNAVKFTPSGGYVSISANEDQGYVVVRVEDSGPGIPEEYRDKIFDRFFQVPGMRSSRRGSGLGLAFCKLVVEAHHGRIWVEPKTGGGSVFSIRLPVQP